MKKILVISFTILSFQFTYAGTCIDIAKNLNKWEESPSVLSLQKFLVSKGLLKATPNGYFGNATFSAVKSYQKSANILQTGTVGISTRASIKKETCNNTSTVAPIVQNNIKTNTIVATSTIKSTATSTSVATPSINKATTTTVYKTPTVSRLSNVTFFIGGTRDWDVYLYGTNFSTSTTNSIYFKSKNTGKKYLIGEVKSLNSTDIIIPRDFMAKTLPCGSGCSEAISLGGYEISVLSNGLESNTIYTTVNSFTSTVVTGTENQALVSKVKGAFFGRLSFAVGAPIQLISVTPVITTEGFSSGTVRATRLTDEATGTTYSASTNTVSAYQSQMMSLYGDLDGPSSGRIMTTFKITVMDYVSRKNTTFSSPVLMTTVTAY